MTLPVNLRCRPRSGTGVSREPGPEIGTPVSEKQGYLSIVSAIGQSPGDSQRCENRTRLCSLRFPQIERIPKILSIGFAMFRKAASLLFVGLFAAPASAQPPEFNYDEAKVPPYHLDDPLVMLDGRKVATAAMWNQERRPELLSLFEQHVFGRTPAEKLPLVFETVRENRRALGGKAIRKEITVWFKADKTGPSMSILLYLPISASPEKPVPAFLGLNFEGNQAATDDPEVALNQNWMRDDPKKGVVKNKATDATRGAEASRWQIPRVVERGYAIATIYYGDLDPDFDDGFQNGVHPLFYKPGQTKPEAGEWGSIGAWAWGLSRALDVLQSEKSIVGNQVAVLGHSRLGKAALWAGAQDQRFAMVISNNSGCGGAALSKRIFGETVGRITTAFPHWFTSKYKTYGENEAALPVDQHQLLALIAPRPLYVASAAEDLWADPRGEYLSAFYASPVYRLLGAKGLPERNEEIPPLPTVDSPLMDGNVAYHVRTGGHDVLAYDWDRYLDFADRQFRKR